ncbi:MAG: hypothetical protein C5B59_07060 [Bacteroidetes bacterium]|nr:MAG: hypothetical protein C5B59_07060 [Bacteroidota bacterium]
MIEPDRCKVQVADRNDSACPFRIAHQDAPVAVDFDDLTSLERVHDLLMRERATVALRVDQSRVERPARELMHELFDVINLGVGHLLAVFTE